MARAPGATHSEIKEDRLFDRGWVRSAMATRKCGNIYFRKYLMAVRKFTNNFVLLLILMVGSVIHYSSFASHKKMYGPTDRPTVAAPKCQPSEDELPNP